MQALVITLISVAILMIVLIIGAVINSLEPYACPNCGHIFNKRWYSLIFRFGPPVKDGGGELRLKCPSCKKVDFCVHTHHK